MEQTFAEDGLSLVLVSWIQTAGGLGREFECDESTLSYRYQEKQIRMTSGDAWESHTPGEITLSEQTLLTWLRRDGRGQHGSVPCLTRQVVPPPCPVASRPQRGGWGSTWDAVGGSSLRVPPCPVAAALHKPTRRCGWSFCGWEADAKQHFYLLACKNRPSVLPAVAQRGGDGVRHGTDPCWPLYRPLPALRSPARSVCSETGGFFWSMGLK